MNFDQRFAASERTAIVVARALLAEERDLTADELSTARLHIAQFERSGFSDEAVALRQIYAEIARRTDDRRIGGAA